MSVEQEFAVVDIVLKSGMRTKTVDAFTLSVVKMERQIRRLFTFLVYQSDAFGRPDVPNLRATLENCTKAYFEGFISGIDALVQFSVADLVGADYVVLRKELVSVHKARNKIFPWTTDEKLAWRSAVAHHGGAHQAMVRAAGRFCAGGAQIRWL